MKPDVSVITPTYNHEEFIADCIESVLRQIRRDWEMIVIDDGSTDETDQTVNPYCADPRVKYISQDNKGLSAARNRGMKTSRENLFTGRPGRDVM